MLLAPERLGELRFIRTPTRGPVPVPAADRITWRTSTEDRQPAKLWCPSTFIQAGVEVMRIRPGTHIRGVQRLCRSMADDEEAMAQTRAACLGQRLQSVLPITAHSGRA